MQTKSIITLIILSVLIICSCNDVENSNNPIFKRELELTGAIQKGPFLIGTDVTINELEIDLTPTGLNYSSQIENNAGLFQLPSIEFTSQYLELKADGYFYNEVQNNSSASQITLYTISDITNRSSININILTTLERPRVKYLLSEGLSYAEAKRQAYNEIMTIFSLPEDEIGVSEDLNISLGGDQNAKLLALSLMILGNRTEAELGELISNISFDIKEDGILNSNNSIEKIYSSINDLDLVNIRENLENRFNDLGIVAIVPNFEAFLPDSMNISALVTEENYTSNSLGSIDITVTGGFPPYSFSWSNSSTTEDLTSIEAGNYTLTVTDSKLTTKSKEFTVIAIMSDIDGNEYKTIKIGDQIWMAENLKVTKYRNGVDIPTGHADSVWSNLSTGGYAIYDNNSSISDVYGFHYNQHAVTDVRGLAPSGWRIPSEEDYIEMFDYLGGYAVAGNKLRESGPVHWGPYNGSATNESGFTALPGGRRFWNSGDYINLGEIGFYWTSSQGRYMELYPNHSTAYIFSENMTDGLSVRCIKDN